MPHWSAGSGSRRLSVWGMRRWEGGTEPFAFGLQPLGHDYRNSQNHPKTCYMGEAALPWYGGPGSPRPSQAMPLQSAPTPSATVELDGFCCPVHFPLLVYGFKRSAQIIAMDPSPRTACLCPNHASATSRVAGGSPVLQRDSPTFPKSHLPGNYPTVLSYS